jgi:uncharacterized membrane protein
MAADTLDTSSVETTAKPTERLLGFSDAVFGIAITFLALDLGEVPEAVVQQEESVSTFLAGHLNDYAVYAGTFLVVGFLWSRHHQLFRYIKRRSSSLVLLNLFLLALVALLPYPAGIVGHGFGLGLAFACLLLPLLVIALLLVAIWELALLQGLAIPDLPSETRTAFRANSVAVVGVLSLALLLAAVSWWSESSAWCYAAMGCGALLIVVPMIVRLRWPTPNQSVYLPADGTELARLDQQHSAQVRALLERVRNGSDTARLCVFTDGVFAIAVTVLALQLQPPARDTALTNQAILDNLSTVPWSTYLVTFAFIGIYWITHVHTFEVVQGTDSILIWLNLIFLLFIGVLPLPAELVNLVGDSAPAWVFYFSMLFCVCIALVAIRIYGARTTTLTLQRELPADARYSIARTLWAGAAFLAGIALVAVSDNPGYSEVVLGLILLRGPVLGRFFPGAHKAMWSKHGPAEQAASSGTTAPSRD